MREMVTFIDMSRREQSMRLDRKVPSIEEFWEYRLGTSAVRIALAINEYVRRNHQVLRTGYIHQISPSPRLI